VPATIRDVAQTAGVSIKTVSRVLNDEPFVRDETRAKVMAAIGKLGFVTNLSAKRLAKGQALTIGLIYHNASWHYILDVQRGLLDTARTAGYGTLMHPCDMARPADAREIVELAAQRQVDGFIFTPPADNARGLLETLDRMAVPFVRLTPSERERAWPYVTATDRAGACEMTRYLLGLGHHRIGFIHGPNEQRAAHDRFAGYRDALAEAGIIYSEHLVRHGDDHFDAGREAARALLDQATRPTAIFCNNDEMASGACMAIHEAGLRIPDDIAVAGFDDIPLARQIWPPLTTVCQPIYDIAAAATRLLIRLLGRGAAPALHQEIPTHLIIRASTAPLKENAS
jgi:LacI family transcriptional regulator